jgi:hypothetical protein
MIHDMKPKILTLAPVFAILLIASSAYSDQTNIQTRQTPIISTDPIDAAHLKYNLKTTVEAYNRIGSKNPKWDDDAKKCLTLFAKIRSWTNGTPTDLLNQLTSSLAHLSELQCDDPLIRYLQVRFISSNANSLPENAAAFGEIASKLKSSQYPDIRKFYAFSWAHTYLLKSKYGNVKGIADTLPEVESLLKEAASFLSAAFNDPTMPIREADQSCDQLMSAPWPCLPGRWNCYTNLEPVLTNRWKDTSMALLAKGRAFFTYAWMARGIGYADSVSDSGWKLMKARLDIAADSLEKAWKLDPQDTRICLEMMRVILGQEKGQDQMELWFQRGMRLDPSNTDLCSAKLEYLRPRWNGSIKEMIEFGRECTLNTNWSGNVRLMLATAYYEASREISDTDQRIKFWRQPGVWNDIQFTYDQYIKLYPGSDNEVRPFYAHFAYRCWQWQAFLDMIKHVSPKYYNVYGGKEMLDKMVNYAEEQVKQH